MSFFQSENLEIRVLDVGQGEAILIKMENKNVLIDGGGPFTGRNQLYPALRDYFYNRIDLWVLTHFDRDHGGNMLRLGGRVSPKEVWIPRLDSSKTAQLLKASFRPRLREIRSRERLFCSRNLCLKGLSVSRRNPLLPVNNSDSVVLQLLQRSNNQVLGLFLGDLSKAGERILIREGTIWGALLVLKIGHHGSKTSTSETLLRALKPEVALISAGRGNRFHFPHGSVVERLERWGTSIFRTDTIGSFKLHFDF